jgi:carboxypeptidase family protein
MMLMLTLLAALSGALSDGVRSAPSTSVVVGVADARTGAPLGGAEVVFPDLRRLALTDWMGEARFANVPKGEHRVRVRKLGYAPSEITLRVTGDSVGPVFFLEPTAPQLDTVRVIAKRGPPLPRGAPEAFGVRQRMGIGRFLTDVDLAPEGDRGLVAVLAGRLPGLRPARRVDGTEILITTRSACGGASRAGSASGARSSCFAQTCPIRVLLDEIDVSEDLNFLARTWDLAGVEYYSATNAPVQYRDARSGCGVLLLWSKR